MKDQNFFVAHYDIIVAVVGALALVCGVAFYFISGGDDPDVAAGDVVQQIRRLKPSETGVKPIDKTALDAAVRLVKTPPSVAVVSEKEASFLSSERRITCKKCKKVIPGDVKAFPACLFCGEKQETPKKIVLDVDGDGLPDEWEKRFGLNPNDVSDAQKDADGDGFTNLEEFKAGTDPKDPTDHPDYLDSVSVQLPLTSTYMPFVFTKAMPLPNNNWRCEFFFSNLKDDYGRMGRLVSVRNGEEIADKKNHSGFIFKSYEKKEAKRTRKGMKGAVSVDVSEVVVQRKSDGRLITLVIAENKKAKPQSVDVKATLSYVRGETAKQFDVTPGDEITLNRDKFKVLEIVPVGTNDAKVTFQNVRTGVKKTLSALAK